MGTSARTGARLAYVVTAAIMSVVILVSSPSAAFAQPAWSPVGPDSFDGIGRPTSAVFQGRTYVFVQNTDNRIEMTIDGGPVQSPAIPGAQAELLASPAAILVGSRLWLFHTGTDQRIYYSILSSTWSPWTAIPNILSSTTPTPVIWNFTPYLFHVGTNGRIYWQSWAGTVPNNDIREVPVPLASMTTILPVAVVAGARDARVDPNEHLYMAMTTEDGDVYSSQSTRPGQIFASDWFLVQNATTPSAPALVFAPHRVAGPWNALWMFVRGDTVNGVPDDRVWVSINDLNFNGYGPFTAINDDLRVNSSITTRRNGQGAAWLYAMAARDIGNFNEGRVYEFNLNHG